METRSNLKLLVNGVVVDLDKEELRDASDRPIGLRPQSFSVLRYLADNPDRVVTKEELMRAVWPGCAVTDDSLVQCIHEIRRAIGDGGQGVLRTVPRRGYRLASFKSANSSNRGALPGRAFIAASVALVAALAISLWWVAEPAPSGAVPLVGVLRFHPVTEDESSRLLARGLTEDIITDLARFPEFDVLASGATEGYRGTSVDPRTIGSALGADFLVEGTIAREADRIHITAKLVETERGRSIWSDRWDRAAPNLFAVQAEIATAIANRLGGGAGVVQEFGRIAARRKAPTDLGAYEAYLIGSEKIERTTAAEIEDAVRLLKRAVRLDPGLARAWVELYHAHQLLALSGIDPEQNRQLAAKAAERAVRLNPSDAEAHAVFAMSLGDRNEFTRAKAEFDAALRLAPNAAEILIFYIGWASAFGEPERGAELVERAIRLNPNYPSWANGPFALAYFMAGQYDRAVDMFERLGTERHKLWSWSAHAGALAAIGRLDDARALVDRALTAHPDLSVELLVNEPGFNENERRRFVETMRLAGFPLCASPATLERHSEARRLPECDGAQ